MFVNINAHPGLRSSVPSELAELSRAKAILSEFKYKKGSEVYGESEPAEYIYQVVEGAVRSHSFYRTGAARSALSTSRATFSVSRTEPFTASRPKRSSTPLYA